MMTAKTKGVKTMPKTGPTPATLAKIKQTNELIKTGIPIQKACKEAGLSYSLYYMHKRSSSTPKATRKYRKKQATLMEIPVVEATPRLWMLYGTPSELASAMRVLG